MKILKETCSLTTIDDVSLLTVYCEVDGITSLFLVDTGASTTFMDSSLFKGKEHLLSGRKSFSQVGGFSKQPKTFRNLKSHPGIVVFKLSTVLGQLNSEKGVNGILGLPEIFVAYREIYNIFVPPQL